MSEASGPGRGNGFAGPSPSTGVARREPVITGSIYDRGSQVMVEDRETWVVRAGPHGGTPIVFLHGIPTSAYLYRDVMRGLHEEHDCIAFDWPGYGRSETPHGGDYTHRARADHLDALLELMDLEKVNLVVHDMGGPAGLLFAMENPDRIEKLVILNTTVFKRDYRPPLPALTQFVPGVRELVRPLFTRPLFDHFMKRGFGRPDRIPKEVLDNHWAIVRSGDGVTAMFESWAQMTEGADAIMTIRKEMAKFPHPVLVMFGAEDPFLPPANAERFARSFPDAQMHLIAGAGHFLQEDAPDIVAERLHKFFG